MIPTFRTPAALAALAAVLLSGVGSPARAADEDDAAARRPMAEELLTTLHLQQMVDAANKRMLMQLDQTTDRIEKAPNAKPEQVADAKQLHEELHKMVGDQLGWDVVQKDMVQVYADAFTGAELKEIAAFYHTPAGQKLVDKQPELSDKLGKVLQGKSMALVPEIRKKIMAVSQKYRPSPPPLPLGVKAPGVPPGAKAPGVPPGAPGAPAPIKPMPAPGTAPTPAAPPSANVTPATATPEVHPEIIPTPAGSPAP